MSHQPTLPVPMTFPNQDKLVHAAAYALMGLLVWRALIYSNKPRLFLFTGSLLFCSAYGLSDEFHQSFIVGRDASVWDWFADTVGALLMVSVLAWRGYKL